MLLQNSRISFVEMGKELGISRVSVRERIKTLEDSGVIKEFTIILNQEKLGKEISLFLNIDVEAAHLETIAEELALVPDVISIYQMTGPSTLHVHLVVSNMEELKKFLYEKLYTLKGIKTVETQVLLRRFKSQGGIRP
ncbi:MAG: Lrp/AsnC family transcriptional regulator [Peptococcaceae bacterium]|nr:Lrp/AsnC family transcriptional regulator [Peptococcaceae bacterium]